MKQGHASNSRLYRCPSQLLGLFLLPRRVGAALRVTFQGMLAMAVMAGVGRLFGIAAG